MRDDRPVMVEAGITLAIVMLMAGAGVVLPLVPAEWLVESGTTQIAMGLLFGVPTGLAYHVRLAASLRRAGLLPARWWLAPVSLHDIVPAEDQRGIMLFFGLGALGFLVTVFGCLSVVCGVLLEGWRSGVLAGTY